MTEFKVDLQNSRSRLKQLTRDYRKAISGTYFSRRWNAFKWKYKSNQTFQDGIDGIIVILMIGIIIAVILGITIVELFNPNL